MAPTPKPGDSREKHLRQLGEALLGCTQEQREEAIKIAARLLALRAKRKSADGKKQPPETSPTGTVSDLATEATYARKFLAQRYAESVRLAPVESTAAQAYGFDPIGWQVFVVLDDHLHVGGSEHIAVNTETGEVKSLGVLGD